MGSRQSDDVNPGETVNNQSSSNATNEPTPVYLMPDSTLQSPDEDRRDKANYPGKK